MSDPCECLYDHTSAMQRLIAWLRDSQDTQNDGLPDAGSTGANSMLMMTLIWGLVALGLFLARPESMRQRRLDPTAPEKPGPANDNNDNGPPPPGLT